MDLNVALTKAAKDASVHTYVLISPSVSNASSKMAYSQVKGELEEAVKKLGFEHCVMLRPGLIVGGREDSRPPEYVFQTVTNAMGAVGTKAKDVWAQDADVVANAAVNAGLHCIEGKQDTSVWLLAQADIVRLGI